MALDLERALDTARRAVAKAGEVALRYFRTDLAVKTKADQTPVTVADREAEEAVVAVLNDAFSEHGIVGEETGEHRKDAPGRWIIDPIDGTRGFARGGFFWGPLVALEHEGEVVVGAMALPALGITYWAAQGLGCFRDGERIRVSDIDQWAGSTLSLGEMNRLTEDPHGRAISSLMRDCASVRSFGDLAGCAMLLDGRAEVWLEIGVQIWDLAAAKVLIEEAGGCFTDFAGRPAITSGSAVGSNGRLHDHVLAALRAL